jgi:DNA-binding transcriptional LysR family regulator
VGLAQVPSPLAAAPIADGRLQALLTRFAVTTPGVFLYHPGKRQVLPKLRAFIEHIKSRSNTANKTRRQVGSGRTSARKSPMPT